MLGSMSKDVNWGLLMTIRDEIKSYISRKGRTMKSVHQELSSEKGLTTTYQNFSKKLANSSLKYEEAHQIADILGYEIVWKEKEKATQ